MSSIRRQKTEAVAAANRANSHASTGPVTHAGKLQARTNALHHGLRADPARVLPQLGEKDEDLLDLQCLGAARRVVESEGFCEMGLKRLEAVYGPEPGLAGAALHFPSGHHREKLNERSHQITENKGLNFEE